MLDKEDYKKMFQGSVLNVEYTGIGVGKIWNSEGINMIFGLDLGILFAIVFEFDLGLLFGW
jgi:hypothetical protein